MPIGASYGGTAESRAEGYRRLMQEKDLPCLTPIAGAVAGGRNGIGPYRLAGIRRIGFLRRDPLYWYMELPRSSTLSKQVRDKGEIYLEREPFPGNHDAPLDVVAIRETDGKIVLWQGVVARSTSPLALVWEDLGLIEAESLKEQTLIESKASDFRLGFILTGVSALIFAIAAATVAAQLWR